MKPKNDMMYQDIYNCICQNTKKWRYTILYVKPTAHLVFKNRFPKGGPTCRRQVVNPRHQTPQGQSKVEFVLTPLRHTTQGYLSDFWGTSSPDPDISALILPMLTRSPFSSLLIFQSTRFSCSSSSDSVMMTKSSAYRFFMKILTKFLGEGTNQKKLLWL